MKGFKLLLMSLFVIGYAYAGDEACWKIIDQELDRHGFGSFDHPNWNVSKNIVNILSTGSTYYTFEKRSDSIAYVKPVIRNSNAKMEISVLHVQDITKDEFVLILDQNCQVKEIKYNQYVGDWLNPSAFVKLSLDSETCKSYLASRKRDLLNAPRVFASVIRTSANRVITVENTMIAAALCERYEDLLSDDSMDIYEMTLSTDSNLNRLAR